VETGVTKEDRAARLQECPAEWRKEVEAHVRCAFRVMARAKRITEQKK
jgi:hypothetical protein